MDVQDDNAAPVPRGVHWPLEDVPVLCGHARSYLDSGVSVVELRGAIDLRTAPEVQVHLDAARNRPGAQVIVDLRPVEFFDCAALGLFCRARRRALEHQGELILVCVQPWHLRILRTAGLSEVFPPFASVQDALHSQELRAAARTRGLDDGCRSRAAFPLVDTGQLPGASRPRSDGSSRPLLPPVAVPGLQEHAEAAGAASPTPRLRPFVPPACSKPGCTPAHPGCR